MIDPRLELAVVEDQINGLKRAMQSKRAEWDAMREQLVIWSERKTELERELETEKNYYVAAH